MRANIQIKPKLAKDLPVEIRKLFVGGIPPNTSFQEFKCYFEDFGELTDALLPLKSVKPNINSGFGFVTFKNPNSALAVLNYSKNHIIKAKRVLSKDRN